MHICKAKKGKLKVGDEVTAKVDAKRRSDIAKNHTATHLLHNALRDVLGDHVHQSGSLVAPDHLRFDFTHFQALATEELIKIETKVNDKIRANNKVCDEHLSLDDALKKGAIALFGEKYDKKVRMISAGSYSRELCGGTHLDSTGEIGSFKITSESSISAGVRRVEAKTGEYAKELKKKEDTIIKEAASALGVKPKDLGEALEKNSEALRKLDKRLKTARQKLSMSGLDDIISTAKKAKDITYVSAIVDAADMQAMRSMTDTIKQKLKSCVVCLGAAADSKAMLVVGVTGDLTKKGIDAAKIIKGLSAHISGGGGGRPDFAQAGGKDAKGLKKAVDNLKELL